jgi:hypothetical protein
MERTAAGLGVAARLRWLLFPIVFLAFAFRIRFRGLLNSLVQKTSAPPQRQPFEHPEIKRPEECQGTTYSFSGLLKAINAPGRAPKEFPFPPKADYV